MDDLVLIVAGRQISGWTEIRVTRGVERCPSDFEIAMTELYPGEPTDVTVQPGDPCQVMLDQDLIVTGYVDRFVPSISPTQHEIRITGRGKCQDLVDCAAEWPNGQISGASALAIAQKLAQPYGITVAAKGPVGAAIPQFNLMIGESAFEVIERVCRYRGLLAYELADGSLLLTQVGQDQAGSGLTEGENAQAASLTWSMDQRFSEYDVFLQSMDVLSDTGQGGNLLEVVKDANVPRHRMHAIIAEAASGAGQDVAKQRGYWEAARRAGRSSVLAVTADSWRAAGGQLWQPNTVVPLVFPTLKLAQANWVIGEVSYRRDAEQGTTAALVLMPPAAFLPEPIVLQPIFFDVPVTGG